LLAGRRSQAPLRLQAGLGLAIDIAAGAFALHALMGLQTGVALLLVVNVGAGALLLRTRTRMAFASIAALITVGEYLLSTYAHDAWGRNFVEVVMLGVTDLAAALVTNRPGRQMQGTQALADRRGAEVADLAQLDELIIRRMRTGVMVVDAVISIQLVNEAAW